MSPQVIIAALIVAGIAAMWLAKPAVAAFKWATSGTGGSGKPDRVAMRAAYDVLKAGLGDDPDLKAIWGKLS